jgi:hypothetical protein
MRRVDSNRSTTHLVRDCYPCLRNECYRCLRNELLPMSQEWTRKKWSGRLDSNQRPSAPKADALPGCATPRLVSSYAIAPEIGSAAGRCYRTSRLTNRARQSPAGAAAPATDDPFERCGHFVNGVNRQVWDLGQDAMAGQLRRRRSGASETDVQQFDEGVFLDASSTVGPRPALASQCPQ